jgi:dihydroorotate dehydrogenase
MLYPIAKKIMMQIDPEKIHDWVLGFLQKTGNSSFNKLYAQTVKPDPVEVMGIMFPNPVGLAAGLDKDGEAIDAFHKMGFGHVEVGTVTPRPQSGNSKPRMFRIKDKNAIINRMGFNNKGVDNLVENLRARRSDIVVGVNIGKNKTTPMGKGKEDYLICMEKVYPYAAYITVNISSPNTPGLRSLQYGELLDELLRELKEKQAELKERHDRYVPLALKIAPDLTVQEIDSIAKSLLKNNFDAVIATNTTLDRESVAGSLHANETGGLSGCPVMDFSTAVISRLHQNLGTKVPIIGVGGINSSADAQIKFEAGAALVQIYTGFIYQGPPLIQNIVNDRVT